MDNFFLLINVKQVGRKKGGQFHFPSPNPNPTLAKVGLRQFINACKNISGLVIQPWDICYSWFRNDREIIFIYISILKKIPQKCKKFIYLIILRA